MRAANAFLLATFTGLAAVAGCSPNSFNSVLDKAPVVSFSTGGSSTGSMFVLPLPLPAEAGTTSAARMLVSRTDNDYLALADFDMNGKVKLYEASQEDKDLLGNTSVYSAAVLPSGTILVGTPRYSGGSTTPAGRVATLKPTLSADGVMALNVTTGMQGGGALSRVGISVAVGNVTGPGTSDFVAVGDASVHVLVGTNIKAPISTPVTNCPAVQLADLVDNYAPRPVVVADLLAGGLSEIALGGQGRVTLVQYDAATGTLPCPTTTPLTFGGNIYFGSSLAVGYFNNDTNADLAVGMPPDKVLVFYGPLDGKTLPDVTITASTSADFGRSISTFGLPGQIPARLLVSAPRAAGGGRAGAGKGMIFSFAPGVTTLTDTNAEVTLFDSNQDAETGKFGGNLGGLMFNTGLCVPGGPVQLVPFASNNTDVLTFFNYVGAISDPRCFAQTP